MPDYSWPPMDTRKTIGKPISRLDGGMKSSGRAKYASDFNRNDLQHAVIVTCPHAHAKVVKIDTSAAEKMPGVSAVKIISPPGTEIQWAYTEVVGIAASTEQIARDAARKVKIDYEVIPHLVREADLAKAGNRAKAAGEQIKGDPDKAFQEADVTVEGQYGIPVINHTCLEPHGQVVEWKGEQVNVWPSTQNVSGIPGDLAQALKIPASNIRSQMQFIGGGFGSKFAADRWGVEGSHLSKLSGGKPVKLFLDRAQDQAIAGNRPSAYGKIKIAAKKDGTITAWQSESWASGGIGGGGAPPIPYVFEIPNQRKNHVAVATNTGPLRAWRAPNHQQACYLTCTAMEDLAAKLKMDPVEFFSKNADLTTRPEVYRAQLKKGAELIEWSKRWHPRGESGNGPVKRGLGLALHTWGGGGHNSQCRTNIHPDGTVEVELCSQDLGTGTRTIITQVAAETLGLPMGAITLHIGDTQLPPSGPSGGSTTVGGVSSSKIG